MKINSIKPLDLTDNLTSAEQHHFVRFVQMCFAVLNIQTDIQLKLMFTDNPDIYGAFSPSLITIRINPFNKNFRNKSEIYRVIAHEVIHFKQFIVGDLRSISPAELVFKGKLIKRVNYRRDWVAYRKTPHEVEAYDNEYSVARQAITLLKTRKKNK